MPNRILVPELRELLAEGRQDDLRDLLGEWHPNDAAEILSGLEATEISQILTLLPMAAQRDVFGYLEPDIQEEIVLGAGRPRVRTLLRALPSDERYELLEHVDDRVRDQLLPLLEQAARADVARRDRYDDDKVGSFLSTEYCELRAEMTVVEALNTLRRQEPSRETIYYSYVVDADKKLIGFVSLRDLIMAGDRQRVGSLMKTELISVRADEDQEVAADLIREYDLLALPVVDADGVLLGIVTFDDAADIQEEEQTEDIERMAGLTPGAEADGGYLQESVLSQIRRRLPLLAFLALFYVLTAAVIADQESSLPGSTLVALLPMIMATGGSVGTQASSLVIRALTVGDVATRDLRRVIWKEMRISSGLALVLSLIVFGEGLLLGAFTDVEFEGRSRLLLLACAGMATAMAAHVVSAAVIGAAVPMLARAMKRDPALVSTPAVTAIADLTGAAIFFTILGSFLLLG